MKRKLDIKNELSAISQTVDNLPRENPFSVPANYFESFAEHVKETTSSVDPQHELFLKENPFQLPEGYFQQFKVHKPTTRTIGLFDIRNVVRYAAAACITGVMITLFFLTDQSGEKEVAAVSASIPQIDLSIDAVETYLSDAEKMSMETDADELADSEQNSLVDLNNEMVGHLLSELSENGLSQYMKLNDLNEGNSSYN
ncbi:MAG: hypothetical protein ACK5AO_04710 [bacterium]